MGMGQGTGLCPDFNLDTNLSPVPSPPLHHFYNCTEKRKNLKYTG